MVNVVKYGSTSIRGLDDLDRIAKRVKDFNEPTVLVPTALEDTTDRIANALYFGDNNARQVFACYDGIVEQVSSPELTKRFDAFCRDFDLYLDAYLQTKSNIINELQLSAGDRLAAYLISVYLNQSGIDSTLVDVTDKDFPLRVTEDRGSLSVDMNHVDADNYFKSKNGALVLPGYVGASKSGAVRTLGRGGGDTAAFVYAYMFGANSVWVVAEDALTTAPIGNSRLVNEIDLDEAWAAGFFGARLRTYRSIEPLGRFFGEHPQAQVFITDKMMNSRKTRINPAAREQTVRFIAARPVARYGIKGDWRGLVNELYRNSSVDWFLLGGMPGEMGIGLPERGLELGKAFVRNAETRGDLEVAYEDEVAYIGVVGSGMSGKEGIANRAYRSLKNINISRTYDPDVSSPNSKFIGIMVDSKHSQEAVAAIHQEFFR
ncbi:MAG: aspartate kinase [Candidatus Aenigmarchaeota archaeon]|nr:aspartate kinase [Candidatus Aenigmarchaeota archaeon]